MMRPAAMFRTLADARRLQIAHLRLASDRSPDEVAQELQASRHEASGTPRELQRAGLAVKRTIATAHIRIAVAEMLEVASSDER